MSALVLIANGTEEIEATVTIDVLRRGDVKVAVLSVESKLTVTCARETKIQADSLLKDHPIQDLLKDHDCLVLPGGIQGAKTFAGTSAILDLIRAFNDAGKLLGSICAGSNH